MKLADLRTLCDSMPAGPWHKYDAGFPEYPGVMGDSGKPVVFAYSLAEDSGLDPQVAEFIAAARAWIPKLLDIVDKAQAGTFHHITCPRMLGYITCRCEKQFLDKALASLETP